MTMTATPIFCQTPFIKTLALAAVTACTTRAPTATAALAAANILELAPVSANGRRIDSIIVSAAASAIGGATTAGLIGIWLWDGTTATLFDELPVTAVTPSATVASFTLTKAYAYNLPAGYKLFASTSVTTTAAANALAVTVVGGDY